MEVRNIILIYVVVGIVGLVMGASVEFTRYQVSKSTPKAAPASQVRYSGDGAPVERVNPYSADYVGRDSAGVWAEPDAIIEEDVAVKDTASEESASLFTLPSWLFGSEEVAPVAKEEPVKNDQKSGAKTDGKSEDDGSGFLKSAFSFLSMFSKDEDKSTTVPGHTPDETAEIIEYAVDSGLAEEIFKYMPCDDIMDCVAYCLEKEHAAECQLFFDQLGQASQALQDLQDGDVEQPRPEGM